LDTKQRRLLNRYIVAYGGQVVPTNAVAVSVTHIITTHELQQEGADVDNLQSSSSPTVNVVNTDWVTRSIERGIVQS